MYAHAYMPKYPRMCAPPLKVFLHVCACACPCVLALAQCVCVARQMLGKRVDQIGLFLAIIMSILCMYSALGYWYRRIHGAIV